MRERERERDSKLKVFETFSGIGAQHKALAWIKEKYKYDYEISYTSEWDIDAIISYNLIHYKNKKNTNEKNLDKEKIMNSLKDFTFSKDGSTPLNHNNLKNIELEKLNVLYNSHIQNNNLGSIKEIKAQHIEKNIDLLTYSFPCTDLSVAGGFWGFNKGMAQESNTRSSLIWEVGRLILELKEKDKLPQFLLMENVKNIISKKHIKDFEKWKDLLSSLGYKHFQKIVNAYEYGIPQKRERVFLISSLDFTENEMKETFEKFDKLKLKTKKLKEILKQNYNDEIYKNEAMDARPNKTRSRLDMFNKNYHLEQENVQYIRTLTTKQDRNPNAGIINLKNTILETQDGKKANYRFLTPREAFLLMGFEENDFNKIKASNFIKKEKLYQQAGNSIVVNAIIPILNTIQILFNKKNKDKDE